MKNEKKTLKLVVLHRNEAIKHKNGIFKNFFDSVGCKGLNGNKVQLYFTEMISRFFISRATEEREK